MDDDAGGRGGMHASPEDFDPISEGLLKSMLHQFACPKEFAATPRLRRRSPLCVTNALLRPEGALAFFRHSLAMRCENNQITFDYRSLQYGKAQFILLIQSFMP